MSLQNISEDEIAFMECWYTPACLIESLFHDFDNLTAFSKEKFGNLRLYQHAMVSDESIIDFELTAEQRGMTKKEMFGMRKKVGNIYNFGARKFGKSIITMIMDLMVTFMTSDGDKIAMSSVDLVHLKQVLEPVKNCLSSHPICKLFCKRVKGSPDFQFETKNNVLLNSVNFNLGGTNPGRQWYGKHVTRVMIEEASLETEEVYEKRKDALSESGAVFRVSGMCDFTPHSPPGKMFYNIDNQKHVLNLPQFVSPFWDEEEKADREEFYGGFLSIGYKVFVLGEVVEDGVSALDMQRIRKACYMYDRKGHFTKDIQRFEISKDTYSHFRNLIIVERPDNAERIFISADIGKKVTEIVVHSEIDDKYEYLYTVVLFNLTQQEIEEILKHLISKLHANVIGIDCGDGEGRGIYSNFQLIYPEKNLVYYDGSMKIKVGFEYEDADEDGEKRIKEEKGEPVFRYEYMSEFSVRRIKELLYCGRCKIPCDYKFDAQFSGVKAMTSGTRTIYKCVSSSGDHLFDAWKVFTIAQWLKKDFNDTPQIDEEDWGVGAV